jgi:hypothetical protein
VTQKIDKVVTGVNPVTLDGFARSRLAPRRPGTQCLCAKAPECSAFAPLRSALRAVLQHHFCALSCSMSRTRSRLSPPHRPQAAGGRSSWNCHPPRHPSAKDGCHPRSAAGPAASRSRSRAGVSKVTKWRKWKNPRIQPVRVSLPLRFRPACARRPSPAPAPTPPPAPARPTGAIGGSAPSWPTAARP